MVEYASEEEQLEALRRWWGENGRSIVIGVIIGLAVLGGWRGWEWYMRNQSLAASGMYDGLIEALDGNASYDEIADEAQKLRDSYSQTPYAPLGAMAAARAAVEHDKAPAAEDWLTWAMNNANDTNVQDLARARLARVVSAEGRHDDALKLLSAEVPKAYTALYAEVRGDILSAKGDREGAVEAYREALSAEIPPPNPGLVQRKLNEVQPNGSTGQDTGDATS